MRRLDYQRNSSWKAKLAQGYGESERKRLLLGHQYIPTTSSQGALPAGEKLWTSGNADTPESMPRRNRAGARILEAGRTGF